MIEVNLNPAGRKQRSGGGFSFSMPGFGRGDSGEGRRTDWWILSAAAIWLLAAGYIGLTYTGVTAEQEDLQVRLETAQADSARFAEQSARIAALRARRDSINSRIATIQSIDQGRYIWPHVMDEVARALPDYTWVTAITAQSAEPSPMFQVEGYAGTQTAVAVFRRQLEASPFLQQVQIQNITAAEAGEGGDEQRVQSYVIQAIYAQPPFEELESVPLFEDDVPPVAAGGD